jgi:hypothetical protein
MNRRLKIRDITRSKNKQKKSHWENQIGAKSASSNRSRVGVHPATFQSVAGYKADARRKHPLLPGADPSGSTYNSYCMRRFVTSLNILLALVFVAPSFGQSVRNANTVGGKVRVGPSQTSRPTLRAPETISPVFIGEKGASPLVKAEILSNLFDTTENTYVTRADGMRVDTFQNAQNETIIDTLYVTGMAETFTSSLKNPYIDSIHIPLGIISVPTANTLSARVMRVYDGQTRAGNYLPFLDFSQAALATATVAGSTLEQGVWQEITFNFLHHRLGTTAANKRFAVWVDRGGTDPFEDSVLFPVEADVADYLTGSSFSIDTTLYHTYLMFRDWYQGYVSQQFWTNIQTANDPSQAFFGDLVMTAYLDDPTAGVADGDNAPMRLDQSYPNPATADGKTNIHFNVQGAREITLKLYNSLGQEISTLLAGPQAAGPHNVNLNVESLPNGTYYYKLQSGDFVATRSMIVNR